MTPDRPNVLVVLTDQQRWDTLGVHGCPEDCTPNLDAAARSGTHLRQTISPQPVCAPCRGCLQTGQHATTHGVWKNARTVPDVDHLLARQFDAAGYRTGYVGKWHLAGHTDPVPAELQGGYDHWRAADLLEFTSHPYEGRVFDSDGDPVRFDGYRVDAMTDMALDFVRDAGDDPFFCFLSYLEPHHQNDMDAYVAPDGYATRHADPHVPGDLRGRPGDWHAELPDYYGIVERIDECYGRIRETLADLGILDETVVLFASDHGSHFRTRNREYKRSCHEASIRVPGILTGPGFDDRTVDDPVSLLDLPPTLLDTAGIEPPDAYAGRSLRPLLDGATSEWRDDVFVQISEAEVGRALRTDRWTYGVYDPEPEGMDQGSAPGVGTPASDRYVERYLYDLHADPHQRENLVGRPDHRDVADRLRERLAERIADVEEPVEIKPARYPA